MLGSDGPDEVAGNSSLAHVAAHKAQEQMPIAPLRATWGSFAVVTLCRVLTLALEEQKEIFDAIVIGAGPAGLSTVRHLLQANVSSVLLLDKSERIGGRSRTLKYGR